jgi:hypothetical protein
MVFENRTLRKIVKIPFSHWYKVHFKVHHPIILPVIVITVGREGKGILCNRHSYLLGSGQGSQKLTAESMKNIKEVLEK